MEICDSSFQSISRTCWARLSQQARQPLKKHDIERLRGTADPLTTDEVQHTYLPLAQLLQLHFNASIELHQQANAFLGNISGKAPFVIGIAGSVAAGKSTVARLLRELLSYWPHNPTVKLVTTDGFLYPNAELKARNLMHRKGFPESYDQRRLLQFVSDIKSGKGNIRAPQYSHTHYDIVPSREVIVDKPDILIIEGLNVLAPARLTKETRTINTNPHEISTSFSALAVSDFFDFSIYIDADTKNLKKWYTNRFLQLRSTAFIKPDSYFHRYAQLNDTEAINFAEHIWETINEPNLSQNILPTRGRANLVLAKDAHHIVEKIFLRKT